MQERIQNDLTRIVRSVADRLKAIDKALTPERDVTIAEFVEHARRAAIARIEVRPNIYQQPDLPGSTWMPSISFASPRFFETYYHSYSRRGRLLAVGYERHCSLSYFTPNRRELDKQYEIQNILTAHGRVLELRQLLPGIDVELVMLGFIRRLDVIKSQEILLQARSSGLKPFPRIPIAR